MRWLLGQAYDSCGITLSSDNFLYSIVVLFHPWEEYAQDNAYSLFLTTYDT